MYKLTKYDKFNIKNLLSLRSNGIKEADLQGAFDEAFLLGNEELASFINKILHTWENDWGHSKTNTEKKMFDHCQNLVEKLFDDDGNIEQDVENIAVNEVIKYVEVQSNFSDIEVNIENFLPITFLGNTGENDDFKNHTTDAYRKNKSLGNHQFSYIAYYMLFVSYLYKVVRSLKTIGKNTIIGEIDTFIKDKLGTELDMIFDLSGIKEHDFCKKINSFIRCLHSNEIDEIANFVQKRNHCAHPSGFIQYSESEVENLISKIDNYTQKIQDKINIELLKYVKNNLETIIFNGHLILSENEVLFLLSKKDEILNFDSDCEGNILKKANFLNLIFNPFTENILFDENSIYQLFIELFKGYNKDEPLYYTIEEMHYFIKSFTNEDKDLIKEIKKIGLAIDDENDCVGFIENI